MSDLWSGVENAATDIFGGKGDSGTLGLGEERVDRTHAINKDSYANREQLEADRQRMLAEYEAARTRQAPTAARVADVKAASVGQAQGVTAPTVAGVTGGPRTQVGAVAGPTAANINTGQQEQFRQGQAVLASQLAEQAAGRGPSVTAQQANTTMRQSLANQVAAAASQRPTGTAAATQRALANSAAVAEANAVGQAASARVAEQVAAREQLGAALASGRGTDVQLAQAQAALQQEAALKGTDVALQRSLSQAELSSREGLARFQAERDRATQQAQLDFEAGRITAEQLNQFQLQQAQLNQQASLANQQTNAQMSLADQEAALKTMGMNDEQVRSMLGGSAQLTQQQYNDMMAYEQIMAENELAYEQMRLGSENAAAERRSGMITGIMGSLAGGAMAMSDPKTKMGIKPLGDDDSNKFLEAMNAAGASKKDGPSEAEKAADAKKKAGMAMALSAMSPGYTKTGVKPIDGSDFMMSNVNQAQRMGGGTSAPATVTAKSVAPSSYAQPTPAPTPTVGYGQSVAPVEVMTDPGKAATPDQIFTYAGTATGGGFGGTGRVNNAADTVTKGQQYVAPTYTTVPGTPQQLPQSSAPAPRTTQPLADVMTIAPKKSISAKTALAAMGGNIGPSLGELAGAAGVGGSGRNGPTNIPLTNKFRGFMGYDPLPEQSLGEAAGWAGMSDPKSKQDVKSGDSDVDSFLDALKAYEYEYKPEYVNKPGAAPGRHVSVMADDLEKTPMGKQAVQEGPDGIKRVDYARLFGPMLAAQASLNDRLHEVEGKVGKKKGGK